VKFTHFFIERPIFATVVSMLIVIIGGVSYFALPVSQYPEIAPPTIQVTASYPGASAETVADTVATPIEQEINGVEGMLYVLSQSTSDGRLTITVTFALGTDLDEAQVLVQNRVAIAEPRLPEAVRALGVTTRQNSPDLMMVVHLLSPDDTYDTLYISNYALTQMIDPLSRLDGVGNITVFGARDYAMRIWLDPNKMAARNLTAGEAIAALRANNLQVASGIINQTPVPNPGAFQLNVETKGRLVEPDEFENIIIRASDDGSVIRVRDVGRVELGAQSYTTNGYLDKQNALPIGIFQRPGSNALETAEEIKTTVEELSKSFPPGLEYQIIYNPTEFIAESVQAVYDTIFEAVILVVLVIVVFLQSLRISLIPILAIPVSLIGTFFIMSALGYSLNNLTLFGLVLAIGIVVDDAIIVVENIERFIDEGMEPREAAHATMDEVSGALIATTLVLVSVFIPAAFITGITGQFFRQFAITVATTTAISSFVSLTLTPSLAAIFMQSKADKESNPKGAFGKLFGIIKWPFSKAASAFNWGFAKLENGYSRLINLVTRFAFVMLIAYGGLLAATYYQFMRAPSGFIPEQDQGYLITVVQLPSGASLDRTDEVVQQVEEKLLAIDGVAHTVAFAGLDGATFTQASNSAAIFTVLDPFEERTEKGQFVGRMLGATNGAMQSILEANIFVIQPPPVRGIGTGGGWKLYIQDRRGRGLEALEQATNSTAGPANGIDGLQRVFTLFNTKTPKIFGDIDRVKAQKIGVTPTELFNALEVYLGSAFVNDFNFLGRTYRVTAQADGPFRDRPDDVLKLRARSQTGEMVPLGAAMQLEEITGPYRVARYNLYPAAGLQGSTAQGFSTGQSIVSMEQLLADTLPDGFGYEWTEIALQEKLAGNTAIYAFALAVIFVFLLLSAQYESWTLPLAIVLVVPLCLLPGITGVLLRGIDVNILVQIGFIVLIGLTAKNAILIVEFAKQAEDEGMNMYKAACHAGRLRLRPILMTSFAFILGVLPLMIATGPGAEMRQSLGTSVFSGLLGATFLGLIFTPVFYVLCRQLGDFADRLLGNGKTDKSQSETAPAE